MRRTIDLISIHLERVSSIGGLDEVSDFEQKTKGLKKKTRMFSEDEKKTLSAQRSTFSYTYYTIYNRNLVGNHRRKIYTNFQWPRRTQ